MCILDRQYVFQYYFYAYFYFIFFSLFFAFLRAPLLIKFHSTYQNVMFIDISARSHEVLWLFSV